MKTNDLFGLDVIKTHNKHIPVKIEQYKGADTTLVVFGGLRDGEAMLPFEFVKSTKDLPCHKVFIRDLDETWYHGVDGFGSIEALKDFLGKVLSILGSKRVILMGNSAGGYGAILYGHLLEVDLVLAFSPQTFLDWWGLRFYKDKRFVARLKKLRRKPFYQRKYAQLATVIGRGKTEYQVIYSAHEKFDVIHAEKLRGKAHVHLKEYKEGGHDLVRVLRDKGELDKILRTILG